MKRSRLATTKESYSLFGSKCGVGERVWDLPNSTPGSKTYASKIIWETALPDGTCLTDKCNQQLLWDMQLFIVSRVKDPRGVAQASAATCGADGRALRVLARWMNHRGLTRITDITTSLTWDYVDYLLMERQARNAEKSQRTARQGASSKFNGLSHSTVWRDVNILPLLFRQREAMKALGGGALESVPYDGRSTLAVVREDIGLRRDGRLMPIPDDVAVPVLNASARLLGVPSRDIISLQKIHDDVVSLGPGQDRIDAYHRNRQRILDFEFGIRENEKRPWHKPITPHTRVMRDGRSVHIKEIQALRRLIVSLQTACVIVLQGLTGLRAHELIGIAVEEELVDGLPSCVTSDCSGSGDIRRYYLTGRTHKGRARDEKWLLGASLEGSGYVPLPVQALLVLHELNSPWRKLGQTKSLLVTFSSTRGLPRREESVGSMTVSALSVLQKEFVAEWVDLTAASEQSKIDFENGDALRPHRWRTTFAMFVMRVSPKLIPALSDHYKHLNATVTEAGYIGTNPALRDEMASARALASAESLLRMTDERSPLIGRGAKLFRKHSRELVAAISKQPGKTQFERTLSYVERLELYLYDAAIGQCLSSFAPSLSFCNKLAGYAGPLRPFPKDEFRTTSNCIKCELLVVSQDHEPYFADRVRKYEEMLIQNSETDEPTYHRHLKQRLKQARQMRGLIANPKKESE